MTVPNPKGHCGVTGDNTRRALRTVKKLIINVPDMLPTDIIANILALLALMKLKNASALSKLSFVGDNTE